VVVNVVIPWALGDVEHHEPPDFFLLPQQKRNIRSFKRSCRTTLRVANLHDRFGLSIRKKEFIDAVDAYVEDQVNGRTPLAAWHRPMGESDVSRLADFSRRAQLLVASTGISAGGKRHGFQQHV
jgi:hypothetical protein